LGDLTLVASYRDQAQLAFDLQAKKAKALQPITFLQNQALDTVYFFTRWQRVLEIKLVLKSMQRSKENFDRLQLYQNDYSGFWRFPAN